MNIHVTSQHVKAAQQSLSGRTPIEIAVDELDCFEEVVLREHADGTFVLDLDGMTVTLPNPVQRALRKYTENKAMRTLSFELALEDEFSFESEEFYFDSIEDDFSYGFV